MPEAVHLTTSMTSLCHTWDRGTGLACQTFYAVQIRVRATSRIYCRENLDPPFYYSPNSGKSLNICLKYHLLRWNGTAFLSRDALLIPAGGLILC